MERQVEALSSTTSTLGRLIPGWAMFLIVFSFLSSLIRLLSARVTSINSSRSMLRNNVVFVLKRARIVPYAFSRSRLPCWSHNKKVLNGGEDVFTYTSPSVGARVGGPLWSPALPFYPSCPSICRSEGGGAARGGPLWPPAPGTRATRAAIKAPTPPNTTPAPSEPNFLQKNTGGELSINGERSDAECVGARFIAPWGWVGHPPLNSPPVSRRMRPGLYQPLTMPSHWC